MPMNILVVEDEDALRLLMAKILRRQGFCVVEASDGTKALELIRALRQRVHVLLLDISLPGASSRDVFEEAARLIPGITVIVTTALSREKASESLAAQIKHFVGKPYRPSALVELIRDIESQKQ